MHADKPAIPTDFPVDVELPLHGPHVVDIDLSTAAATLPDGAQAVLAGFRPSLSQVAADPSRLRLRWPEGSRPGFHGDSGTNWMRDSRVGFAGRTLGGA
jgi:hypothetical protein